MPLDRNSWQGSTTEDEDGMEMTVPVPQGINCYDLEKNYVDCVCFFLTALDQVFLAEKVMDEDVTEWTWMAWISSRLPPPTGS